MGKAAAKEKGQATYYKAKSHHVFLSAPESPLYKTPHMKI